MGVSQRNRILTKEMYKMCKNHKLACNLSMLTVGKSPSNCHSYTEDSVLDRVNTTLFFVVPINYHLRLKYLLYIFFNNSSRGAKLFYFSSYISELYFYSEQFRTYIDDMIRNDYKHVVATFISNYFIENDMNMSKLDGIRIVTVKGFLGLEITNENNESLQRFIWKRPSDMYKLKPVETVSREFAKHKIVVDIASGTGFDYYEIRNLRKTRFVAFDIQPAAKVPPKLHGIVEYYEQDVTKPLRKELLSLIHI